MISFCLFSIDVPQGKRGWRDLSLVWGGVPLPASWTFFLLCPEKIKTCLDYYVLRMTGKSTSSTEKLQMNFMQKLDKNNEREVKKLLCLDKALFKWVSEL